MVVFATYIPFSEINENKPSTIEEFHKAIAAFPRTRMLHICSAMNALLRSEDQPVNIAAHDSLVRNLFDDATAASLLQPREEVRYVFHRQQILFIAKTVILYCADDDQTIAPAQFKELGKVFLMAGDHLGTPPKKPEAIPDKFAYFASTLLPVQEASGFHRFDYKMARSFMMLHHSAPQLRDRRPRYWDIPALFEQTCGLPLLTFQSLLFGALTKFVKFDPKAYMDDPRSYGLDRGWFRSTNVRPELIETFLDCVSNTPELFKGSFEKADWGASDFTPFRDRPLFKDGDYYFLIDFAFLAEKFETGPFWTVHNTLKTNAEKIDLHSFWGEVFERYSNDVLKTASDKAVNAVQDSPDFEDESKGQLCDAAVVCGTSAVFIEMKGATFTSRAKYGSDYHRLMAEVDAKLVQEPDGVAKAVYQLKRAVELAFDPSAPEKVKGLDLRLVDTVYALVVTRDDIGSVFAMNGYLQVKFSAAMNDTDASVRVTPLFCMNAEDFERLCAYLGDTALADLLHAHYRACRERGDYLMTSYFATDGNKILKRLGLRQAKVSLGAWSRLAEIAVQHLGLKTEP
jgi:hypothetical protein